LECWQPQTKRCSVLQQTGAPVYAAAFSPDGTQLAAGDADYTVKLWHVEEGKKRSDIVLPKPANSSGRSDQAGLISSHDDRSLIACFRQNGTRCWDTKSLRQRWEQSFSGPTVVSPDGQHLALVGWGMRNWDVFDIATGRNVRTFIERSPGPI